MDYELARLNSRSFEQLVQALCAKVIAPGMTSFGDGPDGGRDVGYIGQIPYPSAADPWAGVIVVQAKFRQRSRGTKVDTAWALAQLQNELDETFAAGSDRIVPTHYIFATNVSLSSVPKRGGKDQLRALANRYPLDGFEIWDYDQIRTHLDASEDIRRAYLGYIFPGDVLAEISDQLKTEAPDFDEIIVNFVEKELLSDQYAKLEQAGRVADEEIPIARVFVDLPTQSRGRGRTGELIEEVLSIAGEHLDLRSQLPAGPPAAPDDPDRQTRGRLALVGGPGQGKTTAGQFICQLFRTALLKSREPGSITPEAQTAMEAMEAQCIEDDIQMPTVRRFPIRIPLTELSDCLASEKKPNSLLSFMVKRISDRVDRELPATAFRKWLSEYPWLLVLDGLDEVPASSNRTEVLDAIRDFWVDVTQDKTDVLVLATTRPQGYNEDFSPKTYRHIRLAPLSPERALHYGRRLAQARHVGDDARRDKIVTRLERATRNPATAKLMTSPLQVTIMATLVNRGGQPPRERWKLFSDYYGVIYQREVEREIPAADVLRDHQPDIDAIHHRLAMVLQVESEHTQHTEARMSAERFAAIVRQRLSEEGHEGDALAALEQRIITAAADRLVFIVGLEADRVGFEIRSLQEFMAAEALMDGSEARITKRLREIAGITSWRNVFLFAAGQCFAVAHRQHLRDTIYTICGELNDSVHDQLAPIGLPGSILAVDLLADGFTRNQPTYSRLLANEALKLLNKHEAEEGLANAYDPSLASPYREALDRGLEAGPVSRAKCLALLVEMSGQGIDWVEEVLDTHIADDAAGLAELLEGVPNYRTPRMRDRIRAHGPRLPLPLVIRYINSLSRNGERNSDFTAIRRMLSPTPARSSAFAIEPQIQDSELELRLNPIGHFDKWWTNSTPGGHQGVQERWPGLAVALAFARQPRASALARQLRLMAETVPPAEWKVIKRLAPWPLGICLVDAAENRQRLDELATLAEQGNLGDLDQWRAAEARWGATGVGLTDLDHATSHGASIDHAIDVRGFPFGVASLDDLAQDTSGSINLLLDWLDQATSIPARQTLVDWIVSIAETRVVGDQRSDAQRLARAVSQVGEIAAGEYPLDLVEALDWGERFSPEKAFLLEQIGGNIGPLAPNAEAGEYESFSFEVAKQIRAHWEVEQGPGTYRILAAGLPTGSQFAATVLAEATDDLVAKSPGPTGILMLKASEGTAAREAMAKLDEAAKSEPNWLFTATEAMETTGADNDVIETVLRLAWDIVNTSAISERNPDFVVDFLEQGEELIDRRATTLRDAKTWKSLGLFEQPPPD